MAPLSETSLVLNKDGSIYHLNLLPKHIADTIITVGDPSRVYMISQYFDKLEFEMNKREFITHTGIYKGKRLTVMSTGMGTDNIEIFFTELDALVNIDLKKREIKPRKKKLKIIRIGTSGALQEDIPVGAMLASSTAIGLDNLAHFYQVVQTPEEEAILSNLKDSVALPTLPYMAPASPELLNLFGATMMKGNTVTCPGFYAPQGRHIRLAPKYPRILDQLNYFHQGDYWITNFEMETAGYYALGRLLGHDVISLNAIIANRIKNKFSKAPNKIVQALIKTALKSILEL